MDSAPFLRVDSGYLNSLCQNIGLVVGGRITETWHGIVFFFVFFTRQLNYSVSEYQSQLNGGVKTFSLSKKSKFALYCTSTWRHRSGDKKKKRVSRAFAGGQQNRPSSQQTRWEASGDFISHQKHWVKPQADPAATKGHDASRSACQYPFIYEYHSPPEDWGWWRAVWVFEAEWGLTLCDLLWKALWWLYHRYTCTI